MKLQRARLISSVSILAALCACPTPCQAAPKKAASEKNKRVVISGEMLKAAAVAYHDFWDQIRKGDDGTPRGKYMSKIENYDVEFKLGGDHWAINFHPKDPQFKGIAEYEISRDEYKITHLVLGSPPTGKAPIERDCSAYEDSLIRFKCPAGYKMWFSQGSPIDGKRAWHIEPPDVETNNLMNISIREKLDSREKRLLEDIIAESKKNTEGMTIVEGPKKLTIAGAQCLSFKWDVLSPGDYSSLTPSPDNPPFQIPAYAFARCYNKRENFVEISTKLSYYEPGKPGEEYKRNAALFDDFLKTIEFK